MYANNVNHWLVRIVIAVAPFLSVGYPHRQTDSNLTNLTLYLKHPPHIFKQVVSTFKVNSIISSTGLYGVSRMCIPFTLRFHHHLITEMEKWYKVSTDNGRWGDSCCSCALPQWVNDNLLGEIGNPSCFLVSLQSFQCRYSKMRNLN